MDIDSGKIEFIWSSDEINKRSEEYWSIVLDLATRFNLTRIKKCTQIMGRKESDELAGSQIFYPVMQAADVLFLKVDICSLGLDQRKVNMLCREYCNKIKRKYKPVILSHHMLMGLDGSDKMSKSNPDSAIFMDDDVGEVKRKIKKAYCPQGVIEKNPLLEYVKYIIFAKESEFNISRSEENGGDLTFASYQEFEDEYSTGSIHPGDLKPSVIKKINEYLDPVREHFRRNNKAKQLLKTVRSYKVNKVQTKTKSI
jgi:tyrosyl-tRNA synthetase